MTEPTPASAPSGKGGAYLPLQRMFAGVASSYDRLNRLLTFGLDRRWRRLAARACLEGSPRRVLDVGTGTSDLALELARRAGADVEIFAADFSAPMLEAARRKAEGFGLQGRIAFHQADAALLPFPDGHFDAVGIAFAFRNLTYSNPRRELHLRELRRVCARGGRLVVVETSQPEAAWWRRLVHGYLLGVAGPLGGWASGRPEAYRYLAQSASRFFDGRQVTELLIGAGFSGVEMRPLLGGVACLHIARTPASPREAGQS